MEDRIMGPSNAFDDEQPCRDSRRESDSREWTLAQIAPPPPPRRRNLRLAWRRLQELIDDPEQTEKVFELMEAFGGEGDERCFQRFLRSPQAACLLTERPDLSRLLGDADALAAMPMGSLGRRYLEFRERAGVLASGLVELNHDSLPSDAELDPERCWFFDRLTAAHDLWHALTSYGTDEAGEMALLAFSVPQIGSRPLAAIAIAAAIYGPKSGGFELQRFMWQALQRGRRAHFLPAVRWEEMLHLPLQAAREQLEVSCPGRAHPGGVLTLKRGSSQLERVVVA
jgi:ubiquinone biosynthesis protein COQ4